MKAANDDIAAISTPPGEGGIAIVRLSGKEVIEKINRIFKPYTSGTDIRKKKGYTLTLGWILDENQEIIDEVLVGIMRAPKSYTGEDVVEINCHGGTLPARRCLQAILGTGVRLAEPGEFTRRAFLNGRLDASQAEAVIDVIRAKTDKGLKLAMKQITGHTSRHIHHLENDLISLNAMVEASLDFPDEVGDLDYAEAEKILTNFLGEIDKILESSERSEVYRDGIGIAICGKPNVGKSSLLNALLKKERAIVTNIPGTTRDVIEDYINVRGIPVKLMDTAGIRMTEDVVERIGVERSRQVIKEADIVVFLLDVGSGITREDMSIYESIANRNVIVLVNKDDLEEKNIREEDLKELFADAEVIRGSVKEDIGLDELEDVIERMALSGKIGADDLEIMINMRQKNALLKAKKHAQEALISLRDVPLDCLGVDIWESLEALGEITGKNLKEEVIDRIFHDFCIGK